MSSTPPIPGSSASAVQVKVGSGITSTNVQTALVELQGEIGNQSTTAIASAIALDGNYTGLSYNTNTDNSVALNTLLSGYTNDVLTLPEGEIVIDGTSGTTDGDGCLVNIPVGATLRGSGKGTTIKLRNPRTTTGSQHMIRMHANSTLENITLAFDSTTPTTAQLISLLIVKPSSAPTLGTTPLIENVTLRNVKIYGPGQSQTAFLADSSCAIFYYAKNLLIDNCDIKWSSGFGFGIQAIGCDGLRIQDSNVSEHAMDGIKAFGNSTYGTMKRLFVSRSKLNANGQINLQGQTVGTAMGNNYTIADATASGTRFRITATNNYTTIRLPLRSSVAAGTQYLISKSTSSAPTYLDVASTGSNTFTGDYTSGNRITWDGQGSNPTDRIVLLITATGSSSWVSSTPANGEGFDGSVQGAVFLDTEAVANEATGFQLKNDSVALNKTSDVMFVGCRASDSVVGNGFGVVSSSGASHSAMQGFTFINCDAVGNYANGLICNSQLNGTYGLITGVTISGFAARSNKNTGITLSRDVSDVVASGLRLLGNGTGGNQYNLVLAAVRNVKIQGLYMCGVDPIVGGYDTEAAIDAATPLCAGIYMERDLGGLAMNNVTITGVTARRHVSSNDYLYYTSVGVAGTAKDFNTAVKIDKFPTNIDIWQAATSRGILIGDPAGNIMGDRTKENQGIVSGAYPTLENRLTGIMSHRWIFGGYDNDIREAISSYLFGCTHSIVMPSPSGHSFMAGGGTNAMITGTGECGTVLGGAGCTIGKTHPSVVSSKLAGVISNFSNVSNSNTCTIGVAPDLATAGKSGLVTASTLAANPVAGQTITANGITWTQSATVTFGGTNVVTWASHGLTAGDTVQFTGGTPPTNIDVGVNYSVLSVPTSSTFSIAATPSGTQITWSGNGTPTTTGRKMNVVLVVCDNVDVTFETTNDTVVLASHGMKVGDKIQFTSGSVPSGLSLATDYYVINTGNTVLNAGVGVNNFAISTSYDGAATPWTTGGGTASMRKPTSTKSPLEFLITSVGGSTTTFSYNTTTRSTFDTYAPPVVANASWVAVPLGHTDDYSSNGQNTIQGSYNSHIERGSHNRIASGWNSKAKKNVIGSLAPFFSDVFGQDCETNAPYQTAKGFGARPFMPGQQTVASGYVAKPGDFQYTNDLFMRCATTSNAVTDFKGQNGIYANDWTGLVYLPPNTIWLMQGQVIAKKGMTDYKLWTFTATVRGVNVGGFSSVGIMSLSKSLVFETVNSGTTAGATTTTSTWDWSLFNNSTAIGTMPASAIYNFVPQVTVATADTIQWGLHAKFLELAI